MFAPALAAVLAVASALAGEARAAGDDTLVHRLAFGSCAKQTQPAPVWDAIADWKPEVTVLLGDNIYADTIDMDVMKQSYAQLAALPGFQRLRAGTHLVATWDDHDMGADDAGSDYPMRAGSKQAFLDFLGEPADSPRRQRDGVYESYVFGPPGKRVQVILLDTRWFRSPLKRAETPGDPHRGRFGPYQPNDDPSATMLGEAQWQWVRGELERPAEIRLLGSSIQLLAEDHGFEKWMNFPRERERLFATLAAAHATGLIVLSGDRHAAELSLLPAAGRVDELTGQRTANPLGYPLFDLTASSFNAPRPWAWEINRHRVGDVYFAANFGTVEIDWERADPQVTLSIRNDKGETVFAHVVSLSALRAGAGVH